MTFEYIIVFLLGLALGRIPIIYEWLKIRQENKELKKDLIVLKDFLSNSGRGKIVERTSDENTGSS